MTSREFCYWLQGHFEINDASIGATDNLTGAQVRMIQKHLALVFKHEIDPSYPDQEALNKIHNRPDLDDLIVRC